MKSLIQTCYFLQSLTVGEVENVLFLLLAVLCQTQMLGNLCLDLVSNRKAFNSIKMSLLPLRSYLYLFVLAYVTVSSEEYCHGSIHYFLQGITFENAILAEKSIFPFLCLFGVNTKSPILNAYTCKASNSKVNHVKNVV